MVDLRLKIPKEFFEDEIRDGYLVKKEMKEIWAIELDLLYEFQRVCKKNNIKYFAVAGTLLGAVRHQGFIPWDDDIDIVMMRDEYEKLCNIAAEEFMHPYFWQTEATDKGSARGHAQLRNTLTTGILKSEYKKKYPFNQGIFIDIFPMDKLPKARERINFWGELRCLRDEFWQFACTNHRKLLLSEEDTICYKQNNEFYEKWETIASKYNECIGLDKVAMIILAIDDSRFIFDLKDYERTVKLKFEMLELDVPIGYNNILRHTYGTWKEYVVGGSVHGDVIFDVNKSYLDYLKRED